MTQKPLPLDKLVYRMRLMAESGGVITRDRRNVIIEAADRLEEMDERIAIMSETENAGGEDENEIG